MYIDPSIKKGLKHVKGLKHNCSRAVSYMITSSVTENMMSYEDYVKENFNPETNPNANYELAEFMGIPLYKEPFTHNGLEIGRPYCLASLLGTFGMQALPPKVGIYHLFFEGRLVYIGMSKNLRKRLVYHFKDKDMIFDGVLHFVLEEPEYSLEDVLRYESKMIKVHKPPLNTQNLSAYC
jgi:hypothetical protein